MPTAVPPSKHAIVFVHRGEALPPYLGHALRQARLFNACPIHLVADAAALRARPPDRDLGIETVATEDLPRTAAHDAFLATSRLEQTNRFGFWTYVIERFFHLEALAEQLGQRNIVHLESDNLLYADLDRLVPILADSYPGSAVPFARDSRAVPGFFYMKDAAAASRINTFIAETFAANPGIRVHDMQLLAESRLRLGRGVVDMLPVVPSDYCWPMRSLTGGTTAKPEAYRALADRFGSLFDAGPVGQLLGGVDPRNTGGRPTTGFQNESAVYQLHRYRFAMVPDGDGRRVPHLTTGEARWPINHLHLHSKNLEAFVSVRPRRAVSVTLPTFRDAADIPEAEIITSERLQALADVSVIDDASHRFHTSLATTPGIRLCRFRGPRKHLKVDGAAQIATLEEARTIFVYTHLIDSFAEHILPNLTQRFVLLSHASDHKVTAKHRRLLDDVRLIHWFAQNVEIEHPKLTALPIGLANAQWPHGDTAAVADVARRRRPKTGDIYVNFAVRTNPAYRQAVYDALKERPFVTLAEPKPFSPFLEELAAHRFCASPLGNGHDCHRTWEALYLGVVPIVQEGVWMRQFADLPIVAVDRWDRIDEAFLEEQRRRLDAAPPRLEKLTVGYWRERIRAAASSFSGDAA